MPRRPAHWMITAFSMSPSMGYGMLPKAVEYTGVLPFFINVEMPTHSKQGEQIGIRVSVFNYQRRNIEATVILKGSKDYKFVHVEANGIVQSYNPRTSYGEHQFFIWILAQDAEVVYLPIVPTRLGDISVTIYATTVIGSDTVTRLVSEIAFSSNFGGMATFLACSASPKLPILNRYRVRMRRLFHSSL